MISLSNKFSTKWVNFWVFIFCITVIALKGHGGEAAIVLLLTMLFFFIKKNDDIAKYKLNKDEKKFIFIVFLFWSLSILNTLFQPEGLNFENTKIMIRSFDNPSRWILMLPIFFLLRRFKLDWRIISIGLCIGTLISVSVAVYQVYFLNINRATGTFNHGITFGEIMVIVDLFLWVYMIYAWKNKNKLLGTIIFISSLIAFYGSLLSITRGAWLVYIFMLVSYFIYTLKRSINNTKLVISRPIFLRVLLALILFALVSQTDQYKTMKSRTTNGLVQISQGNFKNISEGRATIFKTAIKISQDYPLGVGTDNFRSGGKKLIIEDALNDKSITIRNQNGNVVNAVDLQDDIHKYLWLRSFNADGSIRYTSRWRHAHNEWLNVLAENGILGFILLTLLFYLPFKIFWKNLKNENELVGIYSYCGISLLISFMIFGQTQSVFTSHAALIFFIFFLYLFLAQISFLKNIDRERNKII